jgi:hypothetical protein
MILLDYDENKEEEEGLLMFLLKIKRRMRTIKNSIKSEEGEG